VDAAALHKTAEEVYFEYDIVSVEPPCGWPGRPPGALRPDAGVDTATADRTLIWHCIATGLAAEVDSCSERPL